MSTVRSIERRLYVRRQLDRDLASSATGALPAGRVQEWAGIWTGYVTFAGVALLLISLVFGIGFSSLNPLEAGSWAHASSATLIWSGIALFIAIFFGGMAATRNTRGNAFAKAVALWGLVALSLVFLSGWAAGTASTTAGPALSTVAANSTSGSIATGATSATTPANSTNANTGNVAQGARSAGGSFAWGIFWLTLISFFCCWGGAMAGGGNGSQRFNLRKAA